jgi:hypothetical protein
VRALTDHIQDTLEQLILRLEVDRVALVHAIDEIYSGELAVSSDTGKLEVARGMAGVIEHFARVDPARIELASLRIGRYQERLRALRIRDRAVRDMLPRQGRLIERARLVGLGLLGIVPALVGGAFHWAPYQASAAAGRATRDPTRVASYRLGVALVAFPLTYGLLMLGLSRGLGWDPPRVALAVAIAAVLGLFALFYFQWLSRQWQRIRLVFLRVAKRREVAGLRRERRAIIGMCEAARAEYAVAREDVPRPPETREPS